MQSVPYFYFWTRFREAFVPFDLRYDALRKLFLIQMWWFL